ncbi:hypothetical protein ZIOFF_032274 [Zingiber officinale]|uniref:Uncharacterized protein n=1 Tax=Zingiber officinale TaxID=94328 RepID=A0A8J5GIS6_ZINOF|nr:hypothetical protein ZIOFF_032274 [Zingiber officinale]
MLVVHKTKITSYQWPEQLPRSSGARELLWFVFSTSKEIRGWKIKVVVVGRSTRPQSWTTKVCGVDDGGGNREGEERTLALAACLDEGLRRRSTHGGSDASRAMDRERAWKTIVLPSLPAQVLDTIEGTMTHIEICTIAHGRRRNNGVKVMAEYLNNDLDYVLEDHSETGYFDYFDDDEFDWDDQQGDGHGSRLENANDTTKQNSDTSASEYRNGKDMQGIPWERLNHSRDYYREMRLKMYKNYENLLGPHDELEQATKRCLTLEKKEHFDCRVSWPVPTHLLLKSRSVSKWIMQALSTTFTTIQGLSSQQLCIFR